MTVLLGIATRLRLAKLLLITDLRADLPDFAEAALLAGVDAVQLRDLAADAAALAAGFREMKAVATRRRALAGLCGSGEVAVPGVDLLQLSQSDLRPSEARGQVGGHALIGQFCRTPQQVDAALADPEVDYLMVGPVVRSMACGMDGIELVRYAAHQAPQADPASKPWFASGGITVETLGEVLVAGARRIAVSRAINAAVDPPATAAALKRQLVAAWQADPDMAAVRFGAIAGR